MIQQIIERQNIAEEIRDIPWTDMPLDMLRTVKAVIDEYLHDSPTQRK